MPITNQEWADQIIQSLVAQGVDTFFIAPGSRSTPLTVAIARNKKVRKIVHFDERGNAFATLGYGRGRRKPAVWVTTSGTAVANGYPAVIEASQDEVPMLMLTADRPPELRTTSANQTIDQVHLFGRYVRFFFDIPTPDTALGKGFIQSIINEAVSVAGGVAPGPVHLNCMFREPLVPEMGAHGGSASDPQDMPAVIEPGFGLPGPESLDPVKKRIVQSTRGLVIAGRMVDPREAAAVEALARQLQWPLLADVLSQNRLAVPSQDVSITYYDLLCASPEFLKAHTPDTILYFGKPGVSKQLHTFLAGLSGAMWIQISPSTHRIDPELRVDARVKAQASFFCSAMQGLNTQNNRSWLEAWRAASQQCERTLHQKKPAGLDEVSAVQIVHERIPETHALFLGNSLPVRLANTFGPAFPYPIPVAANRGASGIDGLVATAVGFSEGTGRPCILLLGDLSLLHDLNSLSLIRQSQRQIIVVVLNNDGGGIFSFLPIAAEKDIFTTYFSTPHGWSFREAASMFGIVYACPKTPGALQDELERAFLSGENVIVEITTTKEATLGRVKTLESNIAAQLKG